MWPFFGRSSALRIFQRPDPDAHKRSLFRFCSQFLLRSRRGWGRELVRRGGVIQEAGTKAVKLWLKEATVEFPDAASVPPQIAEQLRSLGN